MKIIISPSLSTGELKRLLTPAAIEAFKRQQERRTTKVNKLLSRRGELVIKHLLETNQVKKEKLRIRVQKLLDKIIEELKVDK